MEKRQQYSECLIIGSIDITVYTMLVI